MKYILIILLANIILTTEGSANSTSKEPLKFNEWVLTTVDQTKAPEGVVVFSNKQRCTWLAKYRTQKTGIRWTCVGVDPN